LQKSFNPAFGFRGQRLIEDTIEVNEGGGAHGFQAFLGFFASYKIIVVQIFYDPLYALGQVRFAVRVLDQADAD
jgi:hypothetical protein